jgi:hypothetical protein
MEAAAKVGRELPERELQLKVNHDMSAGVCAGVDGICRVIQGKLAQGLHRGVLDIEAASFSTYFDAPSAARQVIGLVKAANRIAYATSSSVYKITNDNIYVMINCDPSEVERALASPVPRDTYQLSLSQNLLDFTMLERLTHNEKAGDDTATGLASGHVLAALWDSYKDDKEVFDLLAPVGMLEVGNAIGPVQEQAVLKEIDFSQLTKPGIYKNPDFKGKDALGRANLDQYTVHSTLLLQVLDTKEPKPLTVIPIDVAL